MQKKEIKRQFSLFLCFVVAFSSCNPKTSSSSAVGSKLVAENSSCMSQLTSSLENANLEHSNVDSLALLGGSASTATLTFGDSPSSFSLTESESDDNSAYYEMITYAINPLNKANEEFYRIQLCDETSKCQCYSDLCQGNYTSCTQYRSCKVSTEEDKKGEKYWIKVTKAVDSVPTYGLSKEISLSVKYCAYNYDKDNNSALGGSQIKKREICGPIVQSDNKAYVETLASDKESRLAQKRLEILASLKRKKEAQCAALVAQFGAKAAQAWFTNKQLCSSNIEKSDGEASACVILEALANKTSEFTDLLCGEGHFDNLSLLLALNASGTNATSTSNNFSLVEEEEALSQAACAEASAISDVSSAGATEASSSLTAFSDFFSSSDSLASSYGEGFSEDDTSLEFAEYVVEEEVSDANATTDIYSNEEVDNPPEFDPELAGNLEDSDALEEGMSKEQKMAIFVVCAAVFGALGLQTVVSLVKDLRARKTLSKSEYIRLSSGKNLGTDLNDIKELIGEDKYKSFFEEIDDGKYGFKDDKWKLEGDGLFKPQRISLELNVEDFLEPTFKKMDDKYYAVFNIDEKLAEKFGIFKEANLTLNEKGFEMKDGRLVYAIDEKNINKLGNDNFNMKEGFGELQTKLKNKMSETANFKNLDVSNKKVDVRNAIGTGVKFAAMAGALAGMIYSASEGAFGLVAEDKSSPVKTFLNNLFSDFFVKELMPVSSEAYCYGQSMNSILSDKKANYWSDKDFTACVLKDMKDRQEFLLDLFR